MRNFKFISVIQIKLYWSRWQVLEEGQWPKNVYKVSQFNCISKPVYFRYIWYGSQNSSFFMRIWIEALDLKKKYSFKKFGNCKNLVFEMAFLTNILENLILQFCAKSDRSGVVAILILIKLLKILWKSHFKWNPTIW